MPIPWALEELLPMNNLTVVMDGSPLETPLTGIGRYTLNLANALSQLDDQLDLYLLFDQDWKHAPIDPPAAQRTKRALARRVVQITDFMGWRAAFLRKHLQRIKQQRLFSRGLKHVKPRLVHGPDYYLPKTNLPTIVTVHDISCFRHPETHSRVRVEWQQRTLPDTLGRADHILTVSDFSKGEIADYFSIPEEKITVTPNGVSPDFFTVSDNPALVDVLGRYELKADNFILSVGTLEPRKNLTTLITAYARLGPKTRAHIPLVIAGMQGWGDGHLSRAAEKLIAQGQLRFLGYVPQDDLPYLYAGARIFAYPSIYEGFGMPVIESMAAKTPVITTNRSSLPEVTGGAGICIAPFDEEKWTTELDNLINDRALLSRLSHAGLEQAKGYSWSNTAQITLGAYRSVV